MQWRGQPWGAQVETIGIAQFQWNAGQRNLWINTDRAHQGEGLAIGADQDVLAVVEWLAVEFDAPRPAAEIARGLEHRDAHATSGQRGRGRQPGPAGADDGNVSRRIRRFSHGHYL